MAQQVADTVYVPGCSCRLTKGGYRPSMEKCDRNYRLPDAYAQ